MTTLFVSDLHLDASRPGATELFLRFLREEASQADALYILGDLFEAWVGDDDPSEPGARVAAGLHEVSDAGVPVFFVRGNRDFLLGADYARRCGMTILPDPCVAMVDGRPVLLMHGDLLCSDDTAYQAFRRQVRDPAWQRDFLARPLEARLAFAAQARAASAAHQQDVREEITDVSPATVKATLARFGTGLLIHGHTHRPTIHSLTAGGRPCTRIVLGDWYAQGSVLRVDTDGFELAALG